MLRTFATACIVAVAMMLTTGCTLFGSQLDKAAEGAGKLVTFYCENVTVPEIRDEFRAAVNQHSAPHAVSVQCAQGGAPLVVTPDNATPAPIPPTNTNPT